MILLEGHLEESVRASPIIDKASSKARPTEGENGAFRASGPVIYYYYRKGVLAFLLEPVVL